jgi:PBP1b-binding outer membrane lipoprotein LpoB
MKYVLLILWSLVFLSGCAKDAETPPLIEPAIQESNTVDIGNKPVHTITGASVHPVQ